MNDDSHRNRSIQVNATVTLSKSRLNGANECSTIEFMKRTILEVKSTAPKLILNIILCEPADSDRWSCVEEQTAPPSLLSALSVTATKVTRGADLPWWKGHLHSMYFF